MPLNARYRYTTPTRKGRWHATREAAQDAAVKAGAGHRDQATGRFYADVWTRIEEGE